MMIRRTTGIVLGVLLMTGCDVLSLDDGCIDFGRNFEGDWRVQGTVSVEECESNPSLIGDFDLNSDALPVSEVGGQYVYTGSQENFAMDNISISLSTVSFQTKETTSEGALQLFFDSTDGTCGVIEGDVTGKTPEGCVIRGTFQLLIDPVVESDPIEDAGSVQMGEEDDTTTEDSPLGDEGEGASEFSDVIGEDSLPEDSDASSTPEADEP